jgi:hypothetical protein
MRSTTSSRRRLRSRPPRHGAIEAIARVVDQATVDDPDHVLIYVEEEPNDEIQLGLKPLDIDTHPFSELAGFTAPPEWAMFGMRVRGTAHHLDGDRPPERTSTTYLLHRSGEESSIMRTGDDVQLLPGPAVGTLPDVCRRVLGLPTDPPPATTALLWTVAWLDRIVDGCGDPTRQRGLCSSWTQLALMHPAVRAAADDDLLGLSDPARLVALGRAHAEAWPWSRLRAEPGALHLPDGDLPPDITAWMDDGFYARWALGAFPHPATLARDLSGLLDDELGMGLVAAMAELLA